MVRQRAQLPGQRHRRSRCGTVARFHPDRVCAAGAPRHHPDPQARPRPPHPHLPGLLPAQVSERARPRDGHVGRQDGQEGTGKGGGGREIEDGGKSGPEWQRRWGAGGGDRGGGRGDEEDIKCPHTPSTDSPEGRRHHRVPLCSYSSDRALQPLDLVDMF